MFQRYFNAPIRVILKIIDPSKRKGWRWYKFVILKKAEFSISYFMCFSEFLVLTTLLSIVSDRFYVWSMRFMDKMLIIIMIKFILKGRKRNQSPIITKLTKINSDIQ